MFQVNHQQQLNGNKMSVEKYQSSVEKSGSVLCVGLDPDPNKIPKQFGFGVQAIFPFCRSVIENSKEFATSYKINFAFFEQFGPKGYELIEKVLSEIPSDKFTVADAKRGDIGNSSKAYAKSIFEYYNFDSVTISPYMGKDSATPFLEYEDKITFILALTSNPGSSDFQQKNIEPDKLYETVIKTANTWSDNVAYVFGATKAEKIGEIRKIAKDNILLVPGVGSQGGSAEDVLKNNGGAPILINVSRGIIYPENDIFESGVNLNSKNYAETFRKYYK